MDRLVENLIGILQQYEELYTRMLPMLNQEKNATLGADSERLLQINNEKENIVAQLKALDRQRVALLRQIAKELGLSLAGLTLSSLAEQVPLAYSDRLRSINASLRQLFAEVRRANDESRMLVVHCLGLVKNSLSFFSHWTGSKNVYGATGNMHVGGTGNGRLLSSSV